MKIEITTEELRKYSIFLGTPMYGGSCAGMFCKSTNDLFKVCAQHGIELKEYFLFNESLVQRARNYVVDEFLRSDCTHLLFVDADIGFQAKDVLTLLAIQVSEPEKYQIVTGPYPKKTIAWEKVKSAIEQGKGENPFDLAFYSADYVFNPAKNISSFRIDEPVEVAEGGTGFMLIPRSVFEKYAAAYPELSYKPDHIRTENFDGSREITAFFDCEIDPVSKRYLSEDYFFCRNARKIGITIHMCPWMNLQHVGTYVFRGSMAAIASIGQTPTADRGSNVKNYKNQLTKKNKKSNILGTRP
jgi:hypothetical protein